jgi:penicillin-binding protein 2
MLIVFVVFIIMFSVLINRLFTLQIVDGEKYLNSFTIQASKEREIVSTRANIYDRYGRILATNELAYALLLDDAFDVPDKNLMVHQLVSIIEGNGDVVSYSFPIEIDEYKNFTFTGSKAATLRFKKDLFGKETLNDDETIMQAEEMYQYIKNDLFEVPNTYSDVDAYKIVAIRYMLYQKRFMKYQQEKIATNISEKTLADIRENSSLFPGVTIIEDTLRIYNDSEYFSNIIGYTGKVTEALYEELSAVDDSYTTTDIVGRTGLEQEYELDLKGEKGSETVLVNNSGKIIEVLDRVDPTPGKDIYLTIDRDLQIETYNLLEKQIATVLADKIISAGGEFNQKTIPVDEAIIALLDNNIYSLSDFISEDATETEKNIYSKYLIRKDTSVNFVKEQLIGVDKAVALMNKEQKEYIQYIVSLLKEKEVLKTALIPSDDSVYTSWKNESTTIKIFLKHAIENNYIDLTSLSLTDKYYDSDAIYATLVDFILEKYDTDYNFSKIIYSYMIRNNVVSLKNWCILLYEQGIIPDNEAAIKSLRNNSISVHTFIVDKILSLELPPKLFALDPCSGSAVITDVKTSEVLAMVSYPGYDNNRLVNTIDSEYYSKLLQDKSLPMLNRTVQSRIAPGSIFKMVSALTSLETSIVTKNQQITDLGTFTKVTPSPRCWTVVSGYSHGKVNIVDALAVSCNYFFYEMGYRLSTRTGNYSAAAGLEYFKDYATKLGLNDKSGVELPEYSPRISDEAPVQTAIGQATNNFTTTQLARYINTIARDGDVYEINIVDKIINPNGTVYFDKTPLLLYENTFNIDNISTIKQGMYAVTTSSKGTARRFFDNFPIEVAGKTGTAQENMNRPDHSLFAGYAPYDSPEISGVVIIPFCGSSVTAPLFRDIVGYYYRINEVPTSDQFTNELQ